MRQDSLEKQGIRWGGWPRHTGIFNHDWTQDVFDVKQYKESGRVVATHVFLGKKNAEFGRGRPPAKAQPCF